MGSKIRKLENEHKENLLRYAIEEEELKDDLEKQKSITAAIEKEYGEIKVQLEVAQISEGKAEIKLRRVNETRQDLKIEVEALESENSDQKNNLDEYKQSAQVKVPIKMVKHILCKLCIMKVSLTHAVMFKNVLPMTGDKNNQNPNREDIKRGICSCRIV